MSPQPAHAIECLKADGLQSVWLIAPPGKAKRTLKSWPLTPWMLVKLALGIAQPQRQLRGMRHLRRLGIRTPQSVSSWRFARRDRKRVIELELEFVPGESAWDMINDQGALREPDDAMLRIAARALGSIVARLAAGGVFHRDLKVSNVVIDTSASPPRVWLIDTVGVRRMRHRISEIERMIERLAVQPMGLPQPVDARIRLALLHSALRPLEPKERRAVVARLRERIRRAGTGQPR